ncbi:hypothetical protein NIES4106_28310 [Fischerella sp. NIES-4106]|jgi:hypothetical protein|nr:hypothetical protein NIES4106_28310 [Fischerella sp. NIES-4106]
MRPFKNIQKIRLLFQSQFHLHCTQKTIPCKLLKGEINKVVNAVMADFPNKLNRKKPTITNIPNL